ncbi:MAG TPA: 50S ribosomal protein L18 [Candidatus Rokubacteria bacterium]|nr:50S ribosomal protein L18 [Candidatus Rokubacteria bacterium]
MITSHKVEGRKIRHLRIRRTVRGTPQRPRLTVFRSLNHIYAQVIDDRAGRTLVAASSAEKSASTNGGNIAGAKEIGKLIAQRAQAAGLKAVVFDRGGFLYHGRIKALAEAAREAGLEF